MAEIRLGQLSQYLDELDEVSPSQNLVEFDWTSPGWNLVEMTSLGRWSSRVDWSFGRDRLDRVEDWDGWVGLTTQL